MWTTEEIRNYKIKNDHDLIIFRAYTMLRDRVSYHKIEGHGMFNEETAMASAYESACAILEYAMTDDWAGLNQFDYYREEN